jgi:hypothetical protein
MLVREKIRDVNDPDGIKGILRRAARLVMVRYNFDERARQAPEAQQIGAYLRMSDSHQ